MKRYADSVKRLSTNMRWMKSSSVCSGGTHRERNCSTMPSEIEKCTRRRRRRNKINKYNIWSLNVQTLTLVAQLMASKWENQFPRLCYVQASVQMQSLQQTRGKLIFFFKLSIFFPTFNNVTGNQPGNSNKYATFCRFQYHKLAPVTQPENCN